LSAGGIQGVGGDVLEQTLYLAHARIEVSVVELLGVELVEALRGAAEVGRRFLAGAGCGAQESSEGEKRTETRHPCH